MPDYGLGRLQNHDERNRQFPIRPLLRTLQGQDRPWWRTGVFDQKQESSCTAQATAGCLVTSPLRMRLPVTPRGVPGVIARLNNPGQRYTLYRRAQKLDPWDGDEETVPRYEGSSGLAACKAAKQLGLVPDSWEYRWCFGIADVLGALQLGPVSVGTVWTEGMFHPDSKGHISPTGAEVGGHQYEAIWHDRVGDEVVFVNSWGPTWGKGGRFRLSVADLASLLERGGDAVVWVPG